jgi:F420-dependent oxidoreductase-like protein
MKIGLTARGQSVDDFVEHAQWAEKQGFQSVWYASVMGGDPLVAIAIAGRATTSIELGTAVLQTYPCHPVLQAHRAASVAAAMGRPGFTLGVGPSHESWIRGIYGLSFDTPGRNTEEYVTILTTMLRGEPVDLAGAEWTAHSPAGVAVTNPVPVLVSAMAPRLLRVAGTMAAGTVLYLASARLIETRIVPQISAAAAEAGRPAPRIVSGMPVAVHDDVDEARATATSYSAMFGTLPIYLRVLNEGGYGSFAEAAIVGDESAVTRQLQHLVDAGATDIWAGVFPVGPDPTGSLRRTTDLLATLAG